MVCRRCVSQSNDKLRKQTQCKPVYRYKKDKNVIVRLRVGPYIVKNCDLGLENAALGLRLRAAFLRPRSQFFTIWTSQPPNNIYTVYVKFSTWAFVIYEYYWFKFRFRCLELTGWRQVVRYSQGVVYISLIIPMGTNTKQPNLTPQIKFLSQWNISFLLVLLKSPFPYLAFISSTRFSRFWPNSDECRILIETTKNYSN